jgi:drug/metabolite transporter (DMT)-like permease
MLLGIFQLGLSYYFYTKAIPHVTALEAVLIPVVEPILNPVWVFFVMGERPSPLALGGAGVIITAVTWRALVRPHQQREIESKQRSCSIEIHSPHREAS